MDTESYVGDSTISSDSQEEYFLVYENGSSESINSTLETIGATTTDRGLRSVSYIVCEGLKYPKAYHVTFNSNQGLDENQQNSCSQYEAPSTNNKLDSLIDLKLRTKNLLCMIDEMQATRLNFTYTDYYPQKCSSLMQSKLPTLNKSSEILQIISTDTLNQLESPSNSKEILIKGDSEHNCSVYKKLTRQCCCLNQQDYNEFVIQFNDTAYFTSTMGEIIKNLRILKRFLYMGGDYARRALMFMNEGLSDSKPTEKMEITQGCAHADICNVFDDYTIVTECISWPCKYTNCEGATIQALTASLLYKLVQSEEGQQYLTFSSKITNDLIEVLEKKSFDLEYDTLESLDATLNLLLPVLKQKSNVSYTTTSVEEIQCEKFCTFKDYENSKSYKHKVIIQACGASIEPHFTSKRPRIVPVYTV